MNEQLINHLEEFVTERRKELFEKIISFRTRYICVALEDIYQPQNASAVVRTCDCFGIQDLHIIENRNEYELNPDVTLGSDKWVNMLQYNSPSVNNTISTIKTLRDKGYRIVATTPHTQDTELDQLMLEEGKIALFFGNELNGLSKHVLSEADEFVKIPMFGFTESFNISVSAAIILHHLTQKLRASDLKWQLSRAEKNELKLQWLRNTIKKSEMIEKEFISKLSNNQDIAKTTPK